MLNPDTPLTFVVVHLKKSDGTTSHFMRIGILPPNISYDLCRENIFYVRHGLETCFPFVDASYFFIQNSTKVFLGISFRSLVISFAFYQFLIVNLSDSPEAYPCLLTVGMMIRYVLPVDEKIYIFGYKEPGVLSAYMLDIDRCKFQELSLPILDLYERRNVVISLGKKILTLHVDNQRQFVYDPRLLTWTPVDYKDLLPHFCSILDQPITVEEHNTFYWLDSEANIRAFNYQLSKHYFGQIVGLGHEPIVRDRAPGAAPLFHFKGRLFGIVWTKHNDLHLTLLHVSPGPKARATAYDDDHHLFVNVVSCSQHPIDSNLIVDGAYNVKFDTSIRKTNVVCKLVRPED